MDKIQIEVDERLYLIRIVGGVEDLIYFELGISWDSSNNLFIYWRYSGEEYEYGYIPTHYIQDASLYQGYTLHIKKKVGEETYVFYVNGELKATCHQSDYNPYDGYGAAEAYTNDCCGYPPVTTMKAHFKDLKFGYISRGVYRLQYWNNVSYCVDPPYELIPISSYEFRVMPSG